MGFGRSVAQPVASHPFGTRSVAGKYKVNAGGSSQFISGLLMALPLAETDSILEVEHLASQPYIDMTLQVMEALGLG